MRQNYKKLIAYLHNCIIVYGPVLNANFEPCGLPSGLHFTTQYPTQDMNYVKSAPVWVQQWDPQRIQNHLFQNCGQKKKCLQSKGNKTLSFNLGQHPHRIFQIMLYKNISGQDSSIMFFRPRLYSSALNASFDFKYTGKCLNYWGLTLPFHRPRII